MNNFALGRVVPVGVLLASALGLAACGSSELSHSGLVTDANALCREANRRIGALGAPDTSLPALTAYAAKVLPISRQLSVELASLKASSDDRDALNDLVRAIETGNKGLAVMRTASSTAQTTAASRIIASHPLAAAADRLGASACARPPSA